MMYFLPPEIPLFHVLTARITFGNIFGVDASINKVSTVAEEDRLSCVIEEDAFDPPPSYTVIGRFFRINEHIHML